MAYIQGKPLSKLIPADKSLPERQVAALVRKLALALEEAHRLGVVHRDLKPSNIMIDRRKEPIVMDFGLAQVLQQHEKRLTASGQPLGTPAYMPPEQLSGEVDQVGPRSDVYSLGVILFELLTGKMPFQGPALAVMAQILHKDPPRPSEYRPDLDPRLELICLKAISKNIEDRFGSMGQLAAALGEYLRSTNTDMERPQLDHSCAAGSSEGSTNRKKLLRWSVAGALILGLVVTGLMLLLNHGSGRGSLSDQETREKVRVLLERGIKCVDGNEYAQAISCFSEAIHISPDDAEAYYQRGRAYAIWQKDEQALSDYTYVSILDSSSRQRAGALAQ
jgi:serine/threonine protein kinase